MEFRTLLYAEEAGAVWLTLNRPDRRNALTAQMRAELTAALHQAAVHARAVVLTGAGDSFCSGQDLGGSGAVVPSEIERVLRDEYMPMIEAIIDCPVPVIAAVNGAAAGAGANLALAADVVIATESAVFLQAFSRIGLIPDAGGSYWLPRQVGFARAMGSVLFAEPVPARQAADWGMIWEAVPDAAFEDHVATRVRQIADGPTVAFRNAKAALRASYGNTLAEQMGLEARLQGACGLSRDFNEGLLAFREGRTPRFEGR